MLGTNDAKIVEEFNAIVPYTSRTSPPRDNNNLAWKGGCAIAVMSKAEDAIIFAADRELRRDEIVYSKDVSPRAIDKYIVKHDKEVPFLHDLGGSTACAIIGARQIANKWIGYLNEKSLPKKPTKGESSSRTPGSKGKALAKSKISMATQLEYLTEFQSKYLKGSKLSATEALLVGWNKNKPSLYWIKHDEAVEVDGCMWWIGATYDTTNPLQTKYSEVKDMNVDEIITLVNKAFYIGHALNTTGPVIDVWVLRPNSEITKSSQRMSDLNCQLYHLNQGGDVYEM